MTERLGQMWKRNGWEQKTRPRTRVLGEGCMDKYDITEPVIFHVD